MFVLTDLKKGKRWVEDYLIQTENTVFREGVLLFLRG